jgi:lysophospholipase L1-like esterase
MAQWWQQNGFSLGGFSGGGGAAPVYLPTVGTAPAGVYSMKRIVSGYSGPTCAACATAATATPGSSIDVYPDPVTNKPDFTAAIAAYGATFHVWKLYDQSGNSRDAFQTTNATNFLRPIISTIQPDSADIGWFSLTYSNFSLPVGLATTKKNVSAFSVIAGPEQNATSLSAIICLGTGNSALSLSLLTSDTGLTRLSDGFTEARRPSGMKPTVTGMVSGASAFKIHRDESVETQAALAADVAMTGGYLNKYNNGANYGSIATWSYAHVVYAATLSDADALAVKAALKAIFSIGTKTKAVTYFGDSIQHGQGATSGQNKQFYLNALLSGDPYQLDCGYPGYTSADLLTLYPQGTLNGMFDASMSKNLAVCNVGVNDIAFGVEGGTTAANLISRVTTLIGRFQTAGYPVAMETLTPRTANTADQNTARDTYNAWLVANAASLNFTVIDYTGLTLNRPDGTHPDSAGYALMAGVAAPIINGLLA